MRHDSLSSFDAPTLTTKLDITSDGRLKPHTQDWTCYWRPVHVLGDAPLNRSLDGLAGAWSRYINSGFDPALARNYCYRYFMLLDQMLSAGAELSHLPTWQRALRAVVSFECFTLQDAPARVSSAAAGISTQRNPCYLLATLKWPDIPDDTRYLPLIYAGDGVSVELFSHYRQYRPGDNQSLAILAYLSNDPERRTTSLGAVHSLATAVGSDGDPYVHARASRLWEAIVRPIMQSAHAGTASLDLIDIGAGTGALAAGLCQRLVAWAKDVNRVPTLRLSLVDSGPDNPARVFTTPPLRDFVERVSAHREDYRGWLARPLPPRSGLRIALASKVFDMASRIRSCNFSTPVLQSSGLYEEAPGGRESPTSCLAPNGPGPKELLVSVTRVARSEGHVFRQASLSTFYRAMKLISAPDLEVKTRENDVWLPVRSFDSKCLVTSDGASVLGRLGNQCDYVIAEDADLAPNTLLDHLRRFSLHDLAVCDMTSAMRLTANYAYVLWPRRGGAPQLEGERIW